MRRNDFRMADMMCMYGMCMCMMTCAQNGHLRTDLQK